MENAKVIILGAFNRIELISDAFPTINPLPLFPAIYDSNSFNKVLQVVKSLVTSLFCVRII